MNYIKFFLVFFLQLFLNLSFVIYTYAENKNPVGNIASVVGKVEINRNKKSFKAEKESSLYESDAIVTHENSAVKIKFKDGSHYTAFKNTQLQISKYKIKTNDSGNMSLESAVDVVRGGIEFFVKPKSDDEYNDSHINTPNSVMLIRGTEGKVSYELNNKSSTYALFSGTGIVSNKNNLSYGVVVTPFTELTVIGDRPPTRVIKILQSAVDSSATEALAKERNKKGEEKQKISFSLVVKPDRTLITTAEADTQSSLIAATELDTKPLLSKQTPLIDPAAVISANISNQVLFAGWKFLGPFNGKLTQVIDQQTQTNTATINSINSITINFTPGAL